jgi:saccharopine dehydrogenase-like NADP-dependent oxidoreductase
MQTMTRALVLGSGMVGSVMAADLCAQSDFEVTIADAREEVLKDVAARFKVKTIREDLSKPPRVTELAKDYDIVLGALASKIGLQTLRAVIESKKPYVDISFMSEDAIDVDAFAKEKGAVCVVDCGVAPGMSNMMAGWAAKNFDPCEAIAIYVGGLPVVRKWPYEYKAGFAPHDVIEEYVRPARIVENGKIVVREALSEPELLDFEGVGTLEAFNTDGLRSLAYTLKVPSMKEKTMRYPGHIELMRVFRETGLFSQKPVDLGGARVVPLELTAKLMFPKWTYEPGEADLTVMRVEAIGHREGRHIRQRWDLLDYADAKTGFRSMSRTTGFTATIVATMIARGELVLSPGVHPPEDLGREERVLDNVIKELEKRGVRYTSSVEVHT